MTDYTLVLLTHYPNNDWGGSCDTYEKINWKDLTIAKPTKQELDDYWVIINLVNTQKEKIKELSLITGNLITAGFYSSATGTSRFYASDKEDQLNLIGAVAAGGSIYFASKLNKLDINKSYILHTNTQLLGIINDGSAFKLDLIMKYESLKTSVLSCTDTAQVAAVVWV